jgi:hypothetical protein
VKHVHDTAQHPTDSQPTAYCCFLSQTTNQAAQEAGLESFYDGDIAMEEMPKHGDTRVAVQLQKAHRPMSPRGKLMTAGQLELLHWHFRLGHCSFEQLRKLDSQKHISLSSAARKAIAPKCMSCIMGKAHRRAWKKNKSGKAIRSELDQFAGGRVHIDQLECSQPGLIPQTKGRLRKDHYNCATIFVDGQSDFGHIYLQSSTNAEQTLAAKHDFERRAKTFGREIRTYHGDNGRFVEHVFQNDLKAQKQSLSVCGVGAHHQSGIAERRIRTLSERARANLLHAYVRWPEAISTRLWPFALMHANYLLNNLPRQDGTTRASIFAGTSNVLDLADRHTFGCPIYVLEDPLQTAGGKIPKWNSRVRLGIYLGQSPAHASTVALVLNPMTGHVSSQFHVVFDDDFSTIDDIRLPGEMTEPGKWKELCHASCDSFIDEKHEIEHLWPTLDPKDLFEDFYEESPDDSETHVPKVKFAEPIATYEDTSKVSETSEGVSTVVPPKPPEILERIHTRRSKRLPKPINRLIAGLLALLVIPANCNPLQPLPAFSLAAKLATRDDFSYWEAMKQDDKLKFVVAMDKEVNDHTTKHHWELMPRSAIDPNNKPLQAVWAMKRKRIPGTGFISKYKARLNAHGGQQEEGVNYWDTYAPVVRWMSVRMMLVLTLAEKLHSRSIDFTLAYPQADLDVDIYLELPMGFKLEGGHDKKLYVLKLKKNLYGLKQAGYNWYEKLKGGMLARGFKVCQSDPCVYTKDNIVVLVYVDDMLIFSRSMSQIEKFMRSLDKEYDYTDEGDIKSYLGIDVSEPCEGTFKLSQPHLTQNILRSIGDITLNACKEPATPKEILVHEGEPRKTDWNYRSIVGQLNYLTGSSRGELAFAVHQCARFAADPKRQHEKALLKILRYLKGTPNGGLIITPRKALGLECYVDADFAGGWCKDTSHDPASVLSRSGYVIRLYGCPILWVSKLQTEIALSTTESEYIALSQAMREVIPLLDIYGHINTALKCQDLKPIVKCTVFEDNNGALELATAPKMRPRTKHIAIKYHHFRSKVDSGQIHIKRVDTKNQIADIFTKALPRVDFERIRVMLLGW